MNPKHTHSLATKASKREYQYLAAMPIVLGLCVEVGLNGIDDLLALFSGFALALALGGLRMNQLTSLRKCDFEIACCLRITIAYYFHHSRTEVILKRYGELVDVALVP